MANIEELERQKAELEKQMERAIKNQKKEDLKLVRTLCKRHGFTYNMLKSNLNEDRKKKNDYLSPAQQSK